MVIRLGMHPARDVLFASGATNAASATSTTSTSATTTGTTSATSKASAGEGKTGEDGRTGEALSEEEHAAMMERLKAVGEDMGAVVRPSHTYFLNPLPSLTSLSNNNYLYLGNTPLPLPNTPTLPPPNPPPPTLSSPSPRSALRRSRQRRFRQKHYTRRPFEGSTG